MAVLWVDSFDFYGTSVPALLLRGYTGGASTVGNSALLARTGTGYIQFSGAASTLLTRIADAPLTTCVVGVGIFLNGSTASTNRGRAGIAFRTGVDNNAVRVVPDANLGFSVFNGVTLVGSSAPNLMVIGSYIWLEAKVITGTGTASVEVRVAGVTVLTITGLTIASVTGYGLGQIALADQQTVRFDDFVVNNTDFLGDRRVETLYMDADTVEADWTPSTGTIGFAMIDEAIPSDADFITANLAGDISEFEKQPISLDVNTVAAVCVVARAFKDSAGPSTFRIGVNSAGNVSNSAELLPNTTVAYFSFIQELNPNGNVVWTKAAVDNATVRLTRVV